MYKRVGELEKNSMILFIIMMAGNFLNYLFQIIMGNKLAVEDYGQLTALLSIISILSVISAILPIVTAKYTVQYVHMEQTKKIRFLVLSMFKIVAVCAAIMIIIGIICSTWISETLKIGSSGLIVFTIVTAAASLFASVVLGVLQGLKRFVHYGITSFLAIAGKLLFSLALVAMGWRLFGPLIAITLGLILSLFYGLFHIRDKMVNHEPNISYDFDWREFFSYAGKAFFIQICLSIITNGDILLVKYYFSAQEAGLYSSAMVIGKISLYAAMAIVAALFPMTMERIVKGAGTQRLLYKSLLYSGGIAVCCALLLNLFSEFIIGLLYGARYIPSANLLLPISAFVIPVTLFTIMMNFQLATGQTKPLIITLFGSIVCCGILVQFFHSTMAQMIYCVAAVLSIGVIIDIIIVLLLVQYQQKNILKNELKV